MPSFLFCCCCWLVIIPAPQLSAWKNKIKLTSEAGLRGLRTTFGTVGRCVRGRGRSGGLGLGSGGGGRGGVREGEAGARRVRCHRYRRKNSGVEIKLNFRVRAGSSAAVTLDPTAVVYRHKPGPS